MRVRTHRPNPPKMEPSTLTMKYVNDTEIRVIGMSRSGNHAILQWILEQTPGRSLFLNCVEPGMNPYRSARPLANGQRAVASFEPLDLEAAAEGDLHPTEWLLYSYEDVFLGMVCSRAFEAARDDWVGRSRRQVDVLILRDPFNLLASRRRGGFHRRNPDAPPGIVSERHAVRIWKQHAREFLGERDHLGPEKICISYNRWTRDMTYRQQLAQRLGLPFDDGAALRVPATAGGSSFDGTDADGEAHRMEVTRRWRHFAEDKDFRALFDPDLVDLSDRIFEPLPDISELLAA